MYCFYLSLSASYMANIPSSCGMFVNRALALKVSINAFPGGTPCWLIFLFLFFCILYVWMMLYCKVFDMMINNLAWIFQNTPTSTNNCPNWWHRLMFLVDLKLQKKLDAFLPLGHMASNSGFVIISLSNPDCNSCVSFTLANSKVDF